MRRSDGFSLLEALIALLISLTLLLSFLSLLDHMQTCMFNLDQFMARDRRLFFSPILLENWIAAAGNHRRTQDDGLLATPGCLIIKSDVDGSAGMPDGALTASFESIAIRSNGRDLQVRSGHGSFQPVLKGISSFEAEDSALPVVTIRLSATSPSPLLRWAVPREEKARLLLFLWNYRPNLFWEGS